MFTNNTRRLQPGQGNRHCACDDRGRVLALLDLYFVQDDVVVLVLEGMDRAAFEARYGMYLVLDDIEIDDDMPLVWTVQGAGAVAMLAEAGVPVPDAAHAHTLLDETSGVRVCRKDRSGCGGVDFLIPHGAEDALGQRLAAAGIVDAPDEVLDGLRVLAGRSSWPVDGGEITMVHELAVDKECCAFDKGCYVGQEVINRIDVKGAVQKRRTLVRVAGALEAGAVVSFEERAVGRLTSVVRIGDVSFGLGILRKAVWEPGTIVQVESAGQSFEGGVVAAPVAPSDWA